MEYVRIAGNLLLALVPLGAVFFIGFLCGHIIGVTDVKFGTCFGMKKR